jgi:hypothetical protein
MRRTTLLAIVILAFLGARLLMYYEGIPRPQVTQYGFGNLSIEVVGPVPFNDTYTPAAGGVLLVDMAHQNNFDPEEFNLLFARVIARNYTVKFVRDKGKFNESLVNASTLLVVSPKQAYTDEELEQVKEFLATNGSLVLIDDPSRESEINSLAVHLGIVFNRDYLFNVIKNDGNFRYVVYDRFVEENLTRGLDKVSFYVAQSIKGKALLVGDQNLRSSLGVTDSLSPIAREGRVLAIGDITFFRPPFNSFYNNSKLISNIADFITQSPRKPWVANVTQRNQTTK